MRQGSIQGKTKVVEKDTCQGSGPHRCEWYLHSSNSSLSNEGDCARLWGMFQKPRSLYWQRKPRSLHRQQISNYQSQVSWLRDRLFPWGFFACSFTDYIFYVSLFSHITARSQTLWIFGSLPNQRECLWCNLQTQPYPCFRPLGLPTATPCIRGDTTDDPSLASHPPGNHTTENWCSPFYLLYPALHASL